MVLKPGIFAVIKVFPDHEESIKRLYQESELFRDLCESYQKCVEALKHFNASNSDEAPARREEYATLLKEIKADIMQEIDEFNKTGSSAY